jgi:large subunit ribosomal protein L23
MRINDVIVAPILTEKATNLAKSQVYMFEVHLKATKYKIKEVLEKIYSVKISNIRTMVRKGKVRKVGKKMISKKITDKKIAFVEVIKGKIDIFPQT